MNRGSNSITRIDRQSRKATGNATTGAAPGRAIVCCGGYVWVTNEADSTVSVIDIDTLKTRRVISVGGQPVALVAESFIEQSPPVWVLLADGSMEQIDETTFSVIKSRQIGPKPIGGLGLVHALVVVSGDGTIWLTMIPRRRPSAATTLSQLATSSRLQWRKGPAYEATTSRCGLRRARNNCCRSPLSREVGLQFHKSAGGKEKVPGSNSGVGSTSSLRPGL